MLNGMSSWIFCTAISELKTGGLLTLFTTTRTCSLSVKIPSVTLTKKE